MSTVRASNAALSHSRRCGSWATRCSSSAVTVVPSPVCRSDHYSTACMLLVSISPQFSSLDAAEGSATGTIAEDVWSAIGNPFCVSVKSGDEQEEERRTSPPSDESKDSNDTQGEILLTCAA